MRQSLQNGRGYPAVMIGAIRDALLVESRASALRTNEPSPGNSSSGGRSGSGRRNGWPDVRLNVRYAWQFNDTEGG